MADDDYSTAIAVIFGTAGTITLALYVMIVAWPLQTTLPEETVWGYLGRHGDTAKRVWMAGTSITAAAVVGVFYWIIWEDPDPGVTALAGTIVFMTGAITWPIGILGGSLRIAQIGVVCAAAGNIVLLVFLVTMTSAPPLVIVAMVWSVIHHAVIDGLWAALSPPGAALVAEALL